MTFQLRRMVLVNAGTNKHVASGRITEVDPRGGAAVLGANAVGKTFTLRLIPLFFGHPMRELVALDKGQEGTSFVFRSPTSAVCFEYQRGDDSPENLRLVVMRARADGSDAPEYRILSCGFDKELFIQENRFLTDEGTEAQARARGVVSTKKLTTSEYRSVILRSGYSGQEARKLHGYALAHSFGPRPLPNLDKLVATMVKKSIRFDELVAVAVGLIQDDLGLENQRGTLKMRQQRGELERWMRNLDAARRAVALEPRIQQLRGMLLDFNTAEREWRERHHEVKILIELRELERAQVDAGIKLADEARADAARAERIAIAEKNEIATQAGAKSNLAKSTYGESAAEQRHYREKRAEHWAQELARLLPLRNEQGAVSGQLQAAEAVATSAVSENSKAVAAAERAAGESRRAIESKMSPLREQYDRDMDAIGKAEAAALESLDKEVEVEKFQLESKKAPMDERFGALQAAIDNPAAPAELESAAKDVTHKLLNLGTEATRAGEAVAAAQRDLQREQNAFDQAEEQLRRLKRRVNQAEDDLKQAQSWVDPEAGNLLTALRTHADDGWKRNLARVLNPELLTRTDLNPHALPDGVGDSLYGWRLDLVTIDSPDWADDEALRQGVDRARQALEDSRKAESEHGAKLSALSAALERARNALLAAESAVSVIVGRRTSLQESLSDANDALARAKAECVSMARAELGEVTAKLRELQVHLAGFKSERERGTKTVRSEHDAQRREAMKRRDDSLESFRQAMGAVDAQKEEQLQALNDQLHAQLSEKGVDTKTLGALSDRLQTVRRQIRELTEHEPLADAYLEWLKKGGHDRVSELERQAQVAARHATTAANALEAAQAASRIAQGAHDESMSAARRQSAGLETEVNKLSPLLELFSDYMAQKHDHSDTTLRADEMRRRVKDQHRALKDAEEALHQAFKHCFNELTMTESTVKQLIEGSLEGQVGDEKTRAQLLATAYRRLGEQVVGELHNSLGTVLNQIAQFRRRIATFESEVAKFNTRLQKALGEITRFERLADLKLNIVADFAELDFYGKLKRMDDVMRRHQTDFVLAGAMQLPPNETVEALRDFMGVLGSDGMLEVDLAKHIRLHGSVVENGQSRQFKRASELENISSTGLTTLILITLLVGLVQVVRRGEPVHVPWVTDEVGTFDAANFKALLELLADNRIDVITASPALDRGQLVHFSQRYLFLDRGEICHYQPKELAA